MLNQSFYEQDSITLAQKLLGCILVHQSPEGKTSGTIVETEAYHQDDEASHSFGGKRTSRNNVMFGPAGHAYIYFTYGMHYCFNVVAGPDYRAEAVLIRAIEPLSGIKLMSKRRNTLDALNLCSGPAKLVQAMGITKYQNGTSLIGGELWIKGGSPPKRIISSPRIGITRAIDRPWRFFSPDSPYISKHKYNKII